ncbi:hypothetical protein Ddc_11030 [Ditylenchus destructor]|nr:hypothetical protein Ddc_11030 [Ditylenchus destructor]
MANKALLFTFLVLTGYVQHNEAGEDGNEAPSTGVTVIASHKPDKGAVQALGPATFAKSEYTHVDFLREVEKFWKSHLDHKNHQNVNIVDIIVSHSDDESVSVLKDATDVHKDKITLTDDSHIIIKTGKQHDHALGTPGNSPIPAKKA